MGLGKALERRRMWNSSRMNQTDYSDVSAATYTYLMNGAPPAGNWTGIAAPGERVRLRFVGAGTATFFDVRIPGVELTVVSTRSEEHTSELQSLMRISYAVFCLKTTKSTKPN